MNIRALRIPFSSLKSRVHFLLLPLIGATFISTISGISLAQTVEHTTLLAADSDNDGMSNVLEQALRIQFEPVFMVGRHDCSETPAEFHPDVRTPEPEQENGTIYGQVFPAKTSTDARPVAEVHYYHLWKKDCGPHGHPLDAEHVSVLIRASDTHSGSAKWKALYWYAAAHENT